MPYKRADPKSLSEQRDTESSAHSVVGSLCSHLGTGSPLCPHLEMKTFVLPRSPSLASNQSPLTMTFRLFCMPVCPLTWAARLFVLQDLGIFLIISCEQRIPPLPLSLLLLCVTS